MAHHQFPAGRASIVLPILCFFGAQQKVRNNFFATPPQSLEGGKQAIMPIKTFMQLKQFVGSHFTLLLKNIGKLADFTQQLTVRDLHVIPWFISFPKGSNMRLKYKLKRFLRINL